jgi:hypothetical protein
MNDDRCWHGLCAVGHTFKPVSDAADARERGETEWGARLPEDALEVILRAPGSADVVLEDGVSDLAIREVGELDWANASRMGVSFGRRIGSTSS